jgi:hypothetical protein
MLDVSSSRLLTDLSRADQFNSGEISAIMTDIPRDDRDSQCGGVGTDEEIR